ncbi:ABC transporter permease [Amycolatopsis umgeniensis]|uniref:ABC-2 type transport system permease protein n=1 Tax=Amycolatopsis umgeniensis TaxID=336628 RepID=A0A841B426_9PSEU|nr:ABC transporter permease [Amycolatopsis umgeniensis]MBB5853138.1 ABC-2 type transport system permease protein [Amycolatopsis umgeniensis]
MNTVSSWRAVWLIAKRELNTRLRTRSFVIGTAVLLVMLMGYVLLQATLISNEDKSKIGLTGQTAGIAQQLQTAGAAIGEKIETVPVADPAQGRSQVENGDLDVLLSGNATELKVLVKTELNTKLRAMLTGVSQQEVLNGKLSEVVENPDQVLRTVNETQVEVDSIKPPDPEKDQRMVIGLIVAVLLYMSIVTYGTLVAQGVVEEKSSRVVEILLSTVRPWHLLLGKVIGLGLVGLTQLVIIGGAGLIVASATDVLTLSGVATSALLWGVLWYLLGFLLYATVYGAMGSLVSRQEDTQSVIGPVNIVLILGFVVGFNLLAQAPDGTGTKILSLVPLLSPVLMPARIASGNVEVWEIALSLGLTVGAIALFTWLGARIYQNSVLRVGSRIKLTDALRG